MVIQEIMPEFVPGARIKVIGCGGAGTNAVNRMITEHLEWVECIAVNTDAQALGNSLAPTKINIGPNVSKGLGAGSDPEIGRKAAEESLEEIKKHLQDTDMVFITAGMGGGTGTWSAPVIANLAKEMGILTIGVVTKPFGFEGKKRLQNAVEGIEKLKASVDSLIIIPNDKIFNIVDKKTTFKQAFLLIDKVLLLWVQGITDLIIKHGEINTDFADIKKAMQNSGTALLGIWYAEWENRAVEAARKAIENPLMESHLEWARNIIMAITGGDDLTPMEVQAAAAIVEEIADPDVNLIWGMTFDENYDGEVKVTLIATGFKEVTQADILRPSPSRDMLGRRMKSDDFVGRALRSDKITDDFDRWSSVSSNPNAWFTNSSQNNNIFGKSSKFDETDADIPAFMRNKVK